MYYRVGMPFWRTAARLGARLLIDVEVLKDEQANVFVARSPNLKGLVAEAASAEELFKSVYDCADMLLEQELHSRLPRRPSAAWTGEVLYA
jgi:predicted RNase H-like HicB family nuclease